jgi:hypothetical protein
MITILLSGQARVGKTTAAEFIAAYAKKCDFKPIILPFAKAIKDEALAAGFDKATKPLEYRAYCQDVGESKRKEDPDYWLNLFKNAWKEAVIKDAKAAQDEEKLWKETVIIVDDCRYLNELNFGRTNGAITVFISRGSRDLEDQNADWRKHESEEMANRFEDGDKDYVQMFDWVIKNEGDTKLLHSKLSARLPDWLGLDPHCYLSCDCLGCTKTKKDEPMNLDEFFEELFGDDEE